MLAAVHCADGLAIVEEEDQGGEEAAEVLSEQVDGH